MLLKQRIASHVDSHSEDSSPNQPTLQPILDEPPPRMQKMQGQNEMLHVRHTLEETPTTHEEINDTHQLGKTIFL
jgi:hypothetical protein